MGQAASRQEAFWEACGFGHAMRVKKFIEDGIDVNWVSYTHDCCPIHVASQGKPEIVQLLLEQNCNVNVLDIRGNTPLHHAAMKGHSEIMQTLITAGCKIDTEDKNGWTALHNAAYWCHYKAIKVLLQNRCAIDITNKDCRTALHEVARSKETEEITLGEIARLLIQAGSDIDARGSDLGEADFTGLMFASYHGHYDVASAFIEAGCDLNACGASNNWSALHWAADRGQDELVYLLLEAGIDPTIKAYRGETAADRAKSPEIKQVILNAINMFEEMKGLNVPTAPKTKTSTTSNVQRSPAKNKVTNQMLDNIFSKMPPTASRPPPSYKINHAGDASPKKATPANQLAASSDLSNQKLANKSMKSEFTNQNASSPVECGENSTFESVIAKLSSEIRENVNCDDNNEKDTKNNSEAPNSVKDSEAVSTVSEDSDGNTNDISEVKKPESFDLKNAEDSEENKSVQNLDTSSLEDNNKECSELKNSGDSDLNDTENREEKKSDLKDTEKGETNSDLKETDNAEENKSDLKDSEKEEKDSENPKVDHVEAVDDIEQSPNAVENSNLKENEDSKLTFVDDAKTTTDLEKSNLEQQDKEEANS